MYVVCFYALLPAKQQFQVTTFDTIFDIWLRSSFFIFLSSFSSRLSHVRSWWLQHAIDKVHGHVSEGYEQQQNRTLANGLFYLLAPSYSCCVV